MLSEDEVKKIKELKNKGYTDYRISKEMGIDIKTTQKYLGEKNDIGGNGGSRIRHRSLVTRPSQELVKKTEETEMSLLDANKAKALVSTEKSLKDLKKIKDGDEHPAVAAKRSEVEIAELDIRQLEAKKKLKTLTAEEEVEARLEKRRAKIESIKEKLLPKILREELPADILLALLNAISVELSRIENFAILTEDELLAVATLARDRCMWTFQDRCREIQVATFRANEKLQDQLLLILRDQLFEPRRRLAVKQEMMKSDEFPEEVIDFAITQIPPMTLEETRRAYWEELLRNYPEQAAEAISSIMRTNEVLGLQHLNDRIREAFSSMTN